MNSYIFLTLAVLEGHLPKSNGERDTCGGVKVDIPNYQPIETPPAWKHIPPPFHKQFTPFLIHYLIHTKYGTDFDDKLLDALDYVNDKLNSILKARPLGSDVRLPRVPDPNGGCLSARCGDDYDVPPEYVMPCKLPNGTIVKDGSENFQDVIRDLGNQVHMVIFVRNETCPAPTIVASAVTCYHEQYRLRPAYGHVIICNGIERLPLEMLQSVMLHETIHIMTVTLEGAYFPVSGMDELGTRAKLREACLDKTWKEVKVIFKSTNGGLYTVKVGMTTTPSVQHAAYEHFDECMRTTGAQLNVYENKTDFSHWSDRYFPDEIMAPQYRPMQKLSNLTLGYLNDSTHYLVDGSKAENLISSRPKSYACQIGEWSCHEALENVQNFSFVYRFGSVCDPTGRVKTPLCSIDGLTMLACRSFSSYSPTCYYPVTAGAQAADVSCPLMKNYIVDPIHGLRVGYGTACITWIDPIWWSPKKIKLRPTCMNYECAPKGMALKFIYPNGSECSILLRTGEQNRIISRAPVEYGCSQREYTFISPPIEYICPDSQLFEKHGTGGSANYFYEFQNFILQIVPLIWWLF